MKIRDFLREGQKIGIEYEKKVQSYDKPYIVVVDGEIVLAGYSCRFKEFNHNILEERRYLIGPNYAPSGEWYGFNPLWDVVEEVLYEWFSEDLSAISKIRKELNVESEGFKVFKKAIERRIDSKEEEKEWLTEDLDRDIAELKELCK